MSILHRRIGRAGFAIGYLPVLATVVASALTQGMMSAHSPKTPETYIAFAAFLIWTICLTAWRCHDYGRSAWSNFWTEQAPIIGPLLGLADLLFKRGDAGHNGYGPVPKV